MLKRIISAMLIIISIFTVLTGCKKVPTINNEVIEATKTNFANNNNVTKEFEEISREFEANIDSSKANEGIVTVRYTGTTTDDIRVYVLYNYESCAGYNIKDITKDTVISLTNGIGIYYIEVAKNDGSTETIIATETIKVTSIDEFSPFLYSTYAVYWNEEMEVIKKARELTEDVYNVSERIDIVKTFVIDSLIYMPDDNKDYLKWTYFPDIDEIYNEGKGVCTDFATMFTAICRSQNIPCKLVTGYAGTREELHVWAEVFDGISWKRIDLTLEDAIKTYTNAIIFAPDYYETVTVD